MTDETETTGKYVFNNLILIFLGWEINLYIVYKVDTKMSSIFLSSS